MPNGTLQGKGPSLVGLGGLCTMGERRRPPSFRIPLFSTSPLMCVSTVPAVMRSMSSIKPTFSRFVHVPSKLSSGLSSQDPGYRPAPSPFTGKDSGLFFSIFFRTSPSPPGDPACFFLNFELWLFPAPSTPDRNCWVLADSPPLRQLAPCDGGPVQRFNVFLSPIVLGTPVEGGVGDQRYPLYGPRLQG